MNQTSIFSNLSQKDKIDFYISIAVVVLAGAFILYYALPHTSVTQSDNIILENSLEINQLEINDDIYAPVTNDVLKRERISPVEKIRSVELPQRIDRITNTETNSKIEPNSIIANEKTTVDSKIMEVTEKIESKKSISAAQNQKTNTETIPDNIVIKTKPETTEQQVPTKKQTATATKTSSTDCVIVIGAYGQRKSIDKLTKRLLNDGYKIFRTPYKNLTRLGVYLPCDKIIIEQELVTIRKKYAKDAMILRKEN